MGIEPISTAMTFQAQPVAQQPVVKQEVTTEGEPVVNETPQIDAKTLAVAKTQEGNKGNNEENPNEQDKENQKQVSNEMIRDAMKELNKKSTSVQAEFGIHEGTNRITIKMVDKKTKEVVKELPPEKMLDMIAKVWEYAGLVVDEKR